MTRCVDAAGVNVVGVLPPDTDRSTGQPSILVLAGLLLVAGLPDAMVVPVLRGLTVERYGMSEGAAHLFMSASLIGATVIAGFASRLRRRFGLKRVLCVSAAANALLLLFMALPIGAAATIGVRAVEGAADLMVYAVLFDRIAHSGTKAGRGARLGFAATIMMVGIALGMLLGGVIGGLSPVSVLIAGGAACAALCAAGAMAPLGVEGGVSRRSGPLDPRALVAPVVQIFADRAAAGLLVTTVPLYLATHLGLGPAGIGSRVGTIMLVMALGIWPFGKAVDRFGAVRVRMACTVVFGASLAALPLLLGVGNWSLVVCLVMGGAAAGLFASAVVQAARAGGGAGGMASFYAGGNAGFFVGPLAAAGLLSAFGGASPSAAAYAMVFALFGGAHAVLTAGSLLWTPASRVATSGWSDGVTTVTNRRRAA